MREARIISTADSNVGSISVKPGAIVFNIRQSILAEGGTTWISLPVKIVEKLLRNLESTARTHPNQEAHGYVEGPVCPGGQLGELFVVYRPKSQPRLVAQEHGLPPRQEQEANRLYFCYSEDQFAENGEWLFRSNVQELAHALKLYKELSRTGHTRGGKA